MPVLKSRVGVGGFVVRIPSDYTIPIFVIANQFVLSIKYFPISKQYNSIQNENNFIRHKSQGNLRTLNTYV